MSRVYFHSPSETAELRGSERAYAGGFVSDIAGGMLRTRSSQDLDRLRDLLGPGHYMRQVDTTSPGWATRWVDSYLTAFRVGFNGGLVAHRGVDIDPFTLALNTVMLVGNDQAKLLARLHGQCEIHAYVEGPHRAWLADIIDRGRGTGLYRPEQGWEDVAALLRARDDEPVVMSYSVCESFPNAYSSDWMPAWPEGIPEQWDALPEDEQERRSQRSEAWYDLPDEEQWERGLRWLRVNGPEITPETWEDYRFGHRLTVLDLYDDARLDSALGLVA